MKQEEVEALAECIDTLVTIAKLGLIQHNMKLNASYKKVLKNAKEVLENSDHPIPTWYTNKYLTNETT